MLSRRIWQKRILFNSPCVNQLTRNYQEETNEDVENDRLIFTVHDEKSPAKEPFMKNLFVGKFDKDFLNFPATLNTNRYFEFFDWTKQAKNHISTEIDPSNAKCVEKSNILWHFKELAILRSRLTIEFNGLDLNESEVSFLLETTSSMPWLSSFYLKNNILPIDLINKYCSDEQKAKYLPQIAEGKFLPAICILEDVAGPNVQTINTKAALSQDSKTWLLNGEKKYVANGSDANLFIVFALSSQKPDFYTSDKCLTAFVVEKNFGGISCSERNVTAGLDGLSLCSVVFENTQIPRENVIGEVDKAQEILTDYFLPGNQKTAAQAVALLRMFFNILLSHVIHTKHCDQFMFDLHRVQEVMGKMVTAIYSMESVLYMTTGFEDQLQGQDCNLERAIVQNFCTSECVKNIYRGLQILGAQSYLRKYPYIGIFEDALSLTTMESSNYDGNSYIALLGLRHAGKILQEEIEQRINPFFHPVKTFRRFFFPEKRKPLYIEDNLHPSMEPMALILEDCVYKFKESVEWSLTEFGAEISYEDVELQKIGEMAKLIYVFVAIVSRASRAYCDGIKHSQLDVKIASLQATKIAAKVDRIYKELQLGKFHNGDEISRVIAQQAVASKSYFFQHPLKRNL